MALIGATFSPSARADDWNRKTEVTFNGPVEAVSTAMARKIPFAVADKA